MNRHERARLAQETLAILQRGSYVAPGGSTVMLGGAIADACDETKLYPPSAYAALVDRLPPPAEDGSTTVHVSNQTTLQAARLLRQRYRRIACLNFASAKHPGGGFLGGSEAQEESLARASALYATLQTQPAFYDRHRRERSSLYTDQVIFSPDVPVFRDDDGQLLDAPWTASFLTAAAVNAGAIHRNEPARVAEIVPVMEGRTRMVLAVAAAHGCEALVLGAWGCGVFRNDPATIAAIFARALAEPLFASRF
jgi:uncharacterized protein (TIGR02452 family)